MNSLPFILVTLGFMASGCNSADSESADKKEVPAVEKREKTNNKANSQKKVAMIIAFEGFQHKEYGDPYNAFEKAGYDVVTVSTQKGVATGTGDAKASVELTLDELLHTIADFAAVVFVGGPGSPVFHKDATAHEITRKTLEAGKVLAAICLAPFTLAHAGVLKGVEATAWTDDGEFSPAAFEELGARYVRGPVKTSGRIVTANGPAAAEQFAAAVLEALQANQ